jgi:hypothetical protein
MGRCPRLVSVVPLGQGDDGGRGGGEGIRGLRGWEGIRGLRGWGKWAYGVGSTNLEN